MPLSDQSASERWWLVTASNGNAVLVVSTVEKAEEMAERIEGGWIEVVSRETLESDRFLDAVLDGLEQRASSSGGPVSLNLARWDLKGAIIDAFSRLAFEDRVS